MFTVFSSCQNVLACCAFIPLNNYWKRVCMNGVQEQISFWQHFFYFLLAIKAKLKQITINSDGSRTLVVKEVLNIVHPKQTDKCTLKTILWRASCRCLMPSINLTYLFAGNLDALSNQMVLQENGLIQPWDTKFLKGYQSIARAYRRSRKGELYCSWW